MIACRRFLILKSQFLPKERLHYLLKIKVKPRRLKIISEAFAAEKASRLKEMRKHIDDEILEQEMRVDDLKTLKRPK